MRNETKHTSEPWKIVGATHIWSPAGQANVASCSAPRSIDHVGYAPPDLRYLDETAANARRIVACVNACAPFSTNALEKIAPFNDGKPLFPRSEIHALVLQCDKLEAALKGLIEHIDNQRLNGNIQTHKPYMEGFACALDKARAALDEVAAA